MAVTCLARPDNNKVAYFRYLPALQQVLQYRRTCEREKEGPAKAQTSGRTRELPICAHASAPGFTCHWYSTTACA